MPTKKFPRLFRLGPGQVLEMVRDLHCYLREYKDELRGLLDTIERQSVAVYDTAEMISKMIQAGNLEDITDLQGDELESVIQNSFQFLLTVLLGIHSLGVSRMKEAYDQGLTPVLEAIEPED